MEKVISIAHKVIILIKFKSDSWNSQRYSWWIYVCWNAHGPHMFQFLIGDPDSQDEHLSLPEEATGPSDYNIEFFEKKKSKYAWASLIPFLKGLFKLNIIVK